MSFQWPKNGLLIHVPLSGGLPCNVPFLLRVILVFTSEYVLLHNFPSHETCPSLKNNCGTPYPTRQNENRGKGLHA